jgi:hypothetical protein
MNWERTTFLLVMNFAVLHAGALEERQTPYDRIAERNVFRLHAAEVIKDVPPKPVPLRKITLTGITTILGRPLAFITIEGTKLQPGDSVMIGEGQAMNDIEVRSIDERAGVVRILNGTELQILTFEIAKSTGIQPSWTPAASPAPAASAPVKAEDAMTPEEQTALIELQRIKFQRKGNPIQAILPPTELPSNVNESLNRGIR